MAEFLDPNWQALAAMFPEGQAEHPEKYFDPTIGAWRDPAYRDEEEHTGIYEGDPDAAYALAVAQQQTTAQAGATLPLPSSPQNIITVIIPGEAPAGSALAQLNDWRFNTYGLPANKLAEVRTSSNALVGEPTGVRPGTLPRIVMPEWARRQRGSPL